MAGKGTHGVFFRELRPEQLASLRKKIGLKEWEDGNEDATTDPTSPKV